MPFGSLTRTTAFMQGAIVEDTHQEVEDDMVVKQEGAMPFLVNGAFLASSVFS